MHVYDQCKVRYSKARTASSTLSLSVCIAVPPYYLVARRRPAASLARCYAVRKVRSRCSAHPPRTEARHPAEQSLPAELLQGHVGVPERAEVAIQYGCYFRLESVVTRTSKPSCSATSSKAPFFTVDHVRWSAHGLGRMTCVEEPQADSISDIAFSRAPILRSAIFRS